MVITTAKAEIKTPFYVERIGGAINGIKSYLQGLVKEREIRESHAPKIFDYLMGKAADQEKKLYRACGLDGKYCKESFFWHRANMQEPPGPIGLSPDLKSEICKQIDSITRGELCSDIPGKIINNFERAFLSTLVGEKKRRFESFKGPTYPKRRKERSTDYLWSKTWTSVETD